MTFMTCVTTSRRENWTILLFPCLRKSVLSSSLFSRPFACICIYNVISVVHQKISLLIKHFVVVAAYCFHSAAGQRSPLWGKHGDHLRITVLVDQKIKIPAWYGLEDDAVMLFDSYFTFESKLGWHRLFLTVESTREIRTLVITSCSVWIVGRNGRMGM